MPRLENTGANVDAWCEHTGEASSKADVCNRCARLMEEAPHLPNVYPTPDGYSFSWGGEPQGDDGWRGDVVHPDYANEDYVCAVCGTALTGEDD